MQIGLNVSTVAATLLSCISANALGANSDDWASAQVGIENDSLALKGTSDRWYTNGVRASWTYKDNKQATELGLLTLIPKFLVGSWSASEDGKTKFGGAWGQNMYTPQHIEISASQPNDRPWTGFLYYSGLAQRKSDGPGESALLETSELKFGLVGPGSLAGPTQKLVHRVVGATRPQGWQNQERSGLAFQLNYTLASGVVLIPGILNVSPYASGALGTMKTYLGGGLAVMVGANTLSSSPRAEGDDSTVFDPTNRLPTASKQKSRLFGFAEFDYKHLFRNYTIEGDSLGTGSGINIVRGVNQYSYGVTWSFQTSYSKNTRLTFAQFSRSREFDVAGGVSGPRQRFGGLYCAMDY